MHKLPAFDLPNTGGPTLATRLTKTMILELKSGSFAEASKLPSETELAEKFNVSRSVIRDVMSNLKQNGLIERVRGVGTIIHRDIVNLDNRLDLKFEYYELIQSMGYRPSCDNVRLYTQPATENLAENLETDVGANLIVCEKRVLASGTPVIYSCNYLSESLFSHMDYKLLDWSGSVFNLLEDHCGITVDVSVAKLMALSAPKKIRESLGTEEGAALIMLDEISYYKLKRPIIQAYAYHTNFFEFTILRKKL